MEVLNDFMMEVKHAPDVLVLNTWVWYKPNLVRNVERRYGAIKGWQEKCRKQGRYCHIIWRTTAPGYPRCTDYNQPSTTVEEMEDLVANLTWYPLKGGKRGHWWKFKEQNLLMMESLNKSGLGFEVIPSYDVHILRPDSHKSLVPPQGEIDCLHHCLLYVKCG